MDGVCYHVYNRTAQWRTVFGEPADYWEFLELVCEAQSRTPVELFAVCLMPDRFHLVIRPRVGKDLGAWMQWILSTQMRRWHMRNAPKGRLWRDRFRTFRVAEDAHLLETIRFVEAAPLRARLVQQAQHWPWGSLNWRLQMTAPVGLTSPPLAFPDDWAEQINTPQSDLELKRLCVSLDTQCPYE